MTLDWDCKTGIGYKPALPDASVAADAAPPTTCTSLTQCSLNSLPTGPKLPAAADAKAVGHCVSASGTTSCVACDASTVGVDSQDSFNKCVSTITSPTTDASGNGSCLCVSPKKLDDNKKSTLTAGQTGAVTCVPPNLCFAHTPKSAVALPTVFPAKKLASAYVSPAPASASWPDPTIVPRGVCCELAYEASAHRPTVASWDALNGCRLAKVPSDGLLPTAATQDVDASQPDSLGATVMAACPLDIATDDAPKGQVEVLNPTDDFIHVAVNSNGEHGLDPDKLLAVCNVAKHTRRIFSVSAGNWVRAYAGRWQGGPLGTTMTGKSCVQSAGGASITMYPGAQNPRSRKCLPSFFFYILFAAAIVAAISSLYVGRFESRRTRAIACAQLSGGYTDQCRAVMSGGAPSLTDSAAAIANAAGNIATGSAPTHVGIIFACVALALGALGGVGFAGQQGLISGYTSCSKCVGRPAYNSYNGNKFKWQFGGNGFFCKFLGVGCECNNVARRQACFGQGEQYSDKRAQSSSRDLWDNECCVDEKEQESCSTPNN